MVYSLLHTTHQKSYAHIKSLNIGLEIETCVRPLAHKDFDCFERVRDSTIRCATNLQEVEFVYKRKRPTQGEFWTDNDSAQREQVNREIAKIKKISEKCENYSCGLHFHISSNDLIREKLGDEKSRLFEEMLLLAWNLYFQPRFYNIYPYQLRKNGQTYAQPNSLPLENLRPYLTSVSDPTYIHFEFRGLCPDSPRDIPKLIDNFVSDVKKMYNTVYHIAIASPPGNKKNTKKRRSVLRQSPTEKNKIHKGVFRK